MDGVALDIIIPVYNAAQDLRRCVDSLLAQGLRGCRLTLIDDASTDPAIADFFAELGARALPDVELLVNERNLGFTGAANRGMARSRLDVVLLNSDTIVTAGWIDALRRCAASDPRIATITPFSNNAEIASFPRFCADNGWPAGADPGAVRAALARAAVPTYPDLPTGVGFCLYVRRALLDEVGLFDAAFGLGYGEENDLCLRAARAGWRNVLCDDAFVVHVGSRSFSGQKAELSPRNTAILLERHPHYTRMVEAYIAADPLRPLREAALSVLERAEDTRHGVLHVIHDHGGGTEAHVRALIDASRSRWRHLLAIAVGDAWQVEEHRRDGSLATFEFVRAPGESWRAFVAGLCATFDVALVHLHNISACRAGLQEALTGGAVPYGYTVHDLNFACPTITFLGPGGVYCGGVTDIAACGRCLASNPIVGDVEIADWRARHAALVAGASFVIAPSQWAAALFARYFPGHDVRVVAHGRPVENPPAVLGTAPGGLALPDDGVPAVAVIGAIGPDKGSRRIERLAALARETGAAVRFVLIGYMDVRHAPLQTDDRVFTLHGRYDPRELPQLFDRYRIALALYPSAGPETFSFTLSEAWAAGIAALVPPIGALAERVAGSGAGFVMTDDEWRDERAMLARIVAVTAPERRADLDAARARARAMPEASLAAMAEATLAVYDDAVAKGAAAGRAAAFANARVRDALGYRAWSPPAAATAPPVAETAGAVPAASPRWTARIARAALSLRHTPLGRALYRIAPQPLLDALKARLGS